MKKIFYSILLSRSYLTDNRKIVCIGVNFSSLTRTVEEWKEIIYK